jgi:hypothetical protein
VSCLGVEARPNRQRFEIAGDAQVPRVTLAVVAVERQLEAIELFSAHDGASRACGVVHPPGPVRLPAPPSHDGA